MNQRGIFIYLPMLLSLSSGETKPESNIFYGGSHPIQPKFHHHHFSNPIPRLSHAHNSPLSHPHPHQTHDSLGPLLNPLHSHGFPGQHSSPPHIGHDSLGPHPHPPHMHDSPRPHHHHHQEQRLQKVLPTNCKIEYDILTTQSCSPYSDEVCLTNNVESEEIEYEDVCIDVINKICERPHYHGRGLVKRHFPVTSVTVKHACTEVTNKHCSKSPKVKTISNPVESCHYVKKVRCKDLENKIPKTICKPVTTTKLLHTEEKEIEEAE
ncbi:uncharacterized protein [Lepeophtheirus salmonis]|uniref:uncharacterized protein n=1 Tax=Lepeophtheirus salmonis TaxID=72036 RepID=UPI001AE60134|nr:selenoprotein P-like [Lepeophtheirus salmonis]